ncbi:single-stranded-DNA-specific exonuclease RecJ [Parvularcula maris]|uniref:Single-stranded-DNA-specific exonuclease RecJ n=1 Tax=Parvularcula maris TaxID=2965077 RepID=A0A9X2L8S4_9PROT|nr:single-stranded-DNA-specific exonuclease RecJ [Parvularcula maris]MCQ8185019.1 single-stranded-DNA-specific exonuclease RecJ [Parvularcula maris]
MPLDSTPLDLPLLGVAHSVSGRVWRQRPYCARETETMVQRKGIEWALAQVLSARGIGPADIEEHLAPSLKTSMPDPLVLHEMEAAAGRLADAVIGKETIGIFGDYDVDGTSAAALLFRYLRAVDAAPIVHLPDRFTEGYGPSKEGFASLAERGAKVIVTVDCGSNHQDVVGHSPADVIVLDHHLMGERPDVFALVNPQQERDLSGLKGLSAGGVVFMTLAALNRTLRERGFFKGREEPKLTRMLDLVALSLVADVMPLTGLTRVLVAQGLKVIGDLEHGRGGTLGIKALARRAGLTGQAVSTHLGYQIGPRINAAGRIGHAQTAFDLLVTDDPARAEMIAGKLETLNQERRRIEEEVRRAAISQVEESEPGAAIIAAGEGWHPGVVGIVAGRLKEHFNRPAFCIGFDEQGRGTGSGRSLPGIDLGGAVSQAARDGIIEGGGGHAMAAGLSLRADQVEGFRDFLEDRLANEVSAATQEHPLVLDSVLGLSAITGQTCRAIAPAGPFGQGNPEPRFALEDVVIRQARVVGERHLSLTIEDRGGKTARGIAFGCIDTPLGNLLEQGERTRVHLAGRITPDTWRGGEAAQFQVDDAAEAGRDFPAEGTI